jgi:hypothetical protein
MPGWSADWPDVLPERPQNKQAKETTMRNRSASVAALVVVAGLMFVAIGCHTRAVVPTSYDSYNCPYGNFKIQYPAGWQVEPSGKGRYASVTFTSGDAQIAVETSITGSLIGDQVNASLGKFGPQDVPEEIRPVSVVHQKEKEGFEEQEGVKEEKPAMVKTAMGEGRKSEFKGTSALGNETRGCRITTLSNDYRLRLVCKCPAAEWDALQPAFNKAIETLGYGKVER